MDSELGGGIFGEGVGRSWIFLEIWPGRFGELEESSKFWSSEIVANWGAK